MCSARQRACNHNSCPHSHATPRFVVRSGMRDGRGLPSGCVSPTHGRNKSMKRKRLDIFIGVLTSGLILGGRCGGRCGVLPAGAAPSTTDLQTTVQAVQNAAAAAVAQATGSAHADAARAGVEPVALVAGICRGADHRAVERAGQHACCPDRTRPPARTPRGSRRPWPTPTRRSMRVRCRSVVAADASSSCSTTSVGLNQPGGLADVNAPITAQDNADRADEPGRIRARLGRAGSLLPRRRRTALSTRTHR